MTEIIDITTFDELEAQYPDIAARVKEEIAATVQAAEQKLGAKQGEAKKLFATAEAQSTFEAAAAGIYNVVDLFAGFPGPVDQLVTDIVIPQLPALIDKSVEWFHEQNIFQKVF